jgi:hypothetical protein
MKATLSGRVIGKALETIDPSKFEECPQSEFVIKGRMCTSIMMFVNLIDYNGSNVVEVMAEWQDRSATLVSLQDATGLIIATSSSADPLTMASSTGFILSQNRKADQVLAFLTALRNEREKGVAAKSEIFTDRVAATSQVISPEIITNLLSATHVDAGSITGLTLNVDTVKAKSVETNSLTLGNFVISIGDDGKLQITLRGVATSTTSSLLAIATSSATTTDEVATTTATDTASTIVDGPALIIDMLGNVLFGGDVSVRNFSSANLNLLANVLSAFGTSTVNTVVGTSTATSTQFTLSSGLAINGVGVFSGGLTVDTIGSIGSTTSFLNDTIFIGTPYFTKDTAGFATVAKGAKSVVVAFDKDYIEQPIVSASMTLSDTDATSTGDLILAGNIRYLITNKSVHGFTIRLSEKAPEDIHFSWIAIAVKGAKNFTERNAAYEEGEGTAPPSDNTATTTPTNITSSSTATAETASSTASESGGTSSSSASTVEAGIEPSPPATSAEPETPEPSGGDTPSQ